ncbi:unnamed protein product [Rotaria sp. Silwood2]|nr:unnamed protein product [Rotaria sp. Silwood2]CAF4286699.1 unnamed protein product [Rotaria sp. Silwood2]
MNNYLQLTRDLGEKRRHGVRLENGKVCCGCNGDLPPGQFAIKIVYWSGGLNIDICLQDFHHKFPSIDNLVLGFHLQVDAAFHISKP